MIDLHVHSTASDGTFSPARLAELGRGFSVMALTDHDCTDGAEEFLSVPASGPRIVGAELDVDPGEGYRRFHLLAYGFDRTDPAMLKLLATLRHDREERNLKMVERLNALGLDITVADWMKFSPGLLARPNLARALVAKGYASNISEAFDRWVGDDAPGYVRRHMRDPGEAIDTIHAAHGIAVMAHPIHWTRDENLLRSGLAALKDRGLDGLECEYQANQLQDTVLHLRIAKELDLAPTAGSDFHGGNKPDITLGMSVGNETEFLKPFFRALERRS